MLLNHLFGQPEKLEIYIELEDGKVVHKTRTVPITIEHDLPSKGLFPISKVRK